MPWFYLAVYLLGSINFSLLAAWLAGKGDLRRYGSKNPGAANVYRLLGAKWAVGVVVLDVARGLGVGLLAGLWLGSPWLVLTAALLLLLGNLYPVFHGFRGGKGFATAMGLYLAVDPLTALICALVWLGLVLRLRISSLGTLTAAFLFPLLLFLHGGLAPPVVLGIVVLAVIVFSHRGNIRRLIRGIESRVTPGSKRR